MTSVFIAPTPRKLSKNDLKQIEEEQEKIGQMVHGFYEKIRTKIAKSLTKCENKNTLLCRQLFDSLSLHPQQELYETIRIHDLIFNQIEQASQAITEFTRKMDLLHDKLKAQLTVQQQRSTIKREKGPVGENAIAVLRKVSFKREKHALKHRLLALDTVNRRLLKCEATSLEEQAHNGFRLDIEGKKTEGQVLAYSKIWFESKHREYLLCLTKENKLSIYNDKLQPISIFPTPHPLALPINCHQIGNYVFLVTPYQVTRISLLSQTDILSKKFRKQILRAQSYNGGLVMWVFDRDRQHSVLFLDEQLQAYGEVSLKMSIGSIPWHFKLNGGLYFLAASYMLQAEVYKVDGCDVLQLCQVGRVEEVVPVRCGKETEEIIFRMPANRFVKFVDGTIVALQVEIDQAESIRSCAVLGEHFYALSENGKAMLECHYQPPLKAQP